MRKLLTKFISILLTLNLLLQPLAPALIYAAQTTDDSLGPATGDPPPEPEPTCTTDTFVGECGFSGDNWCRIGQNCTATSPNISVTCPSTEKIRNIGTYCVYPDGRKTFSGYSDCVPDSSCWQSTPEPIQEATDCTPGIRNQYLRKECDPTVGKMVWIEEWLQPNCDVTEKPGSVTDEFCPHTQPATPQDILDDYTAAWSNYTADIPAGTTQPPDTPAEPTPIITYPGEPICSLSAIPQTIQVGNEITWHIYADPAGISANWIGPDLSQPSKVEGYPEGTLPNWFRPFTYNQPASYTRQAVINYSSAPACTTNSMTVTITSPSVGAAAVEPDINIDFQGITSPVIITNESRQLADINQDVAVTTDQPPPDLPPLTAPREDELILEQPAPTRPRGKVIIDAGSQDRALEDQEGLSVQYSKKLAQQQAQARQANEGSQGNPTETISSTANNAVNVGLGVAGAVGGAAGNLFNGIGQLFQPQDQKQAEEAIKKAEGIYVEPGISTGIPDYCSAGDFNGTPETNPECYPQQKFERAKEIGERAGFKVEGDPTNFGISLTGAPDLRAYTVLNEAPLTEEENEAAKKSVEALAHFVISLLPGGAFPELVEKSNKLAVDTFVTEAVCKQAGFVDASYVRSLLAQTPKSGQKQRKEILELGKQVNPQFGQQIEETKALTYEELLARAKVQDPSLEDRLAEAAGLSQEEAKARCGQETTALETKIKDLNTETAVMTSLEVVGALPVAEVGVVAVKKSAQVARPFVRKITDPIGDVAKGAWDATLGRIFGGAGKEVAQESAEKARPPTSVRTAEQALEQPSQPAYVGNLVQKEESGLAGNVVLKKKKISEGLFKTREVNDFSPFGQPIGQGVDAIVYGNGTVATKISVNNPKGLVNQAEFLQKMDGREGLPKFYGYVYDTAGEVVGYRMEQIKGVSLIQTPRGISFEQAKRFFGDLVTLYTETGTFHGDLASKVHINPMNIIVEEGTGRLRMIDYSASSIAKDREFAEQELEGLINLFFVKGPFGTKPFIRDLSREEADQIAKKLLENVTQPKKVLEILSQEVGRVDSPQALKTPDQPLYVGEAQSIPTQVTSGLKEAVDRIVPKDLGRPARQRLDEIISYETKIEEQIAREVEERGGVYIPPPFEDKAEAIRQVVPDLWSGSTRIIRRDYNVYIQQYPSGLVSEMPLTKIPRGMAIFPSSAKAQGKLIRVYRGGNIGGFNQPQLAPILRDGSVTLKDIEDLREGRISLETLASKISNPDDRRLAEYAIEIKRESLEKISGRKTNDLEILLKVHQDCERGVNCGSIFVSTTTDPLVGFDFTMGGSGFRGVLVLDIPESQTLDFNKIRFGHAVEGGEQEIGVFGEIKPEWIKGFIFKDSNMTGAQFTKALADFDRAVENPEAYYAVLTKQGGRGAVQESVPKGAFQQPINLSDKEAIKNLAEKAFPDGEMAGKSRAPVMFWIDLGATEDLIQKKADQARKLVDYMLEGGGVPTEGIRTARPPGPDAPQEIKDAWQALRFDGGFEAREGIIDFKRGDLVVAVTDALINQHINVRDPKMAAVLNKVNSKLEELGAYVAQNNPYPHPQSTAYRVGNEQVHIVSANQFDRILKRPEAAGFADGNQIVLRQGVASRDAENAIRIVLHECTHICQFTLANRTEIQQVFRTLGVDNLTKLDEGVTEFATQFVSDNSALREAMRSDQLLAPLVSSTKEQYKIWAYRDLVAAVHDELIPEIMRKNGFSREQASAIVINTVRNGEYTELFLSVGGAGKLNEIFGKFPEIVGNTSTRSTRVITPTDKQLALLKAKAEISAGSPPEEIPKSLPWRLVGSVFAQEEKAITLKVLDTSTLEALTKKELIKNALIEDGQVDASFVKEVAKTEIFTAETGRTPNGYILATGKSGLVEGNLEQDKYKVEIASIPGVDIKVPGVVEVKVGQETVIPVAIKKGTGKVEKTVPPTGWQWLLNKLFGTVFAQEKKESPVQLVVFSDTNNTGKIDKDEQVLPWAGLKMELKKVNQDRTLPLTAGWNLVALEVLPAKAINASTLLQDIAKQGGYATTVSTLENGAWKSFVVRGDKTYSGDDFPITPGKAYFVKALKSSVLVYQGQELVAPIKLNLASGWNGVGVPYSEKPYQAADFIDTLNTKGAGADTAGRWESGLWDTFVKLQDQRYGENFMIEQGRGYLLKVAKGLEFSP